jgi:hypothetical protein
MEMGGDMLLELGESVFGRHIDAFLDWLEKCRRRLGLEEV